MTHVVIISFYFDETILTSIDSIESAAVIIKSFNRQNTKADIIKYF